MIYGGCLSGAVTFTVEGPMRPVIACHCCQCRKSSGNYVTATSAHRDHVEITGDVRWYVSSDTARRGFCPVCGTPLFWDGAGENLSIFAGALDQPTGLQVAGHIYCADKGDWYDLPEDGARRAPGYDPELTTMVRE